MPRAAGGTHAEYHRARWEEDYRLACEGKGKGAFDADEWREALAEIGREHGYLKPPSEGEAMNALIRVSAGRGSQADRDVLAARERAHGGGK